MFKISRTMHRCHDATKLADLLRASLVEVVSASGISEGHPMKVSPRTLQQVESILRICCFHRVAWTLDSASKMIDDGNAVDVDVVLSLSFLTES